MTTTSISNEQEFHLGLAERLIKNAWETKRLASSYLFWGPSGSGRFVFAKILAKTVNCELGSFPPCSSCLSCRKTENNNHPDVHYIEKENSNFIRIEQIQQMQREVFLHPFEGRYKVFIIQNTEDFTSEAANSLLKILEEPPRDSLFILIASDLRRIFSTIISRCHKIHFYSKPPRYAEDVLIRDYHCDRQLSHYLAFAFEGKLTEALKFKDSDILKERDHIIKNFIVNPNSFFDKFDSKDKDSLDWILRVLISCVRDIYLLKAGIGKEELINQDIREQMAALSEKYSFSDLDNILMQLCNYFDSIRQNINPRLLIDNLKLLWIK